MKIWLLSIFYITISAHCKVAIGANSNDPTHINFSQGLPNSGNLVLGVYTNNQLGDFGEQIDKISQGDLKHAITITEFDGKFNSTQLITAPRNSGLAQILMVGLGDKGSDHSLTKWEELGGKTIQKAIKSFDQAPALVFDVKNSQINAHMVYGAQLGAYYFDKYYTDEKRVKYQQQITAVSHDVSTTEKYFRQELEPVAEAIWHTRDISNEPANVIYPASFVDRWKHHFRSFKQIKIKVFDEQDMLDQNMGAIYGVGQGSQRPPRMMVVEYMNGEKGDQPILLVGKGITFDTGGISLKNPDKMWNMKFDMSGAASVMGTVYALAGRSAKVNVVAIAALAENMASAHAQRPGDVVTSMSGKTIEIRSTDAEGRLVLADGNYYGDTTYNPLLMVNVATLTGSASRATGKDYAAMFTRHDELVQPFIEAGKETGEQVWHLPLNKNHFKAIEAKTADVMNSGPDAPGASAGAAFLGTFVRETTPWVHLDIAGVAWNDKPTPTKASPGSTSFGVRLLNGYIKTHFEN